MDTEIVRVDITIDVENESEIFWSRLHRGEPDAPPEVDTLLETDEIRGLTPARAAELWAWFSHVDGWITDDAPESAPHPLMRYGWDADGIGVAMGDD